MCLVVGDSLLVVDAAVQGDVDAEDQESHAASLSHTIARGCPGACACRSRRSPPDPGGAGLDRLLYRRVVRRPRVPRRPGATGRAQGHWPQLADAGLGLRGAARLRGGRVLGVGAGNPRARWGVGYARSMAVTAIPIEKGPRPAPSPDGPSESSTVARIFPKGVTTIVSATPRLDVAAALEPASAIFGLAGVLT